MNMKRYVWIAFVLAFSFSGCFLEKSPEERGADVVASVSKCARLYTVQYNVRKVLTHQDFSEVELKLFWEKISIPIPGERKIILPMDATVKAYIDFADFSSKDVSVVGDKITITLPSPKIEMTSSKIDYENEKQFLSWNRFKFSEPERESLLKKGREKVLDDMKGTDILERSQVGAYNALLPLVMAAGFDRENITIRFSDDVSGKPVKALMWNGNDL
jgi:hypothetical protein